MGVDLLGDARKRARRELLKGEVLDWPSLWSGGNVREGRDLEGVVVDETLELIRKGGAGEGFLTMVKMELPKIVEGGGIASNFTKLVDSSGSGISVGLFSSEEFPEGDGTIFQKYGNDVTGLGREHGEERVGLFCLKMRNGEMVFVQRHRAFGYHVKDSYSFVSAKGGVVNDSSDGRPGVRCYQSLCQKVKKLKNNEWETKNWVIVKGEGYYSGGKLWNPSPDRPALVWVEEENNILAASYYFNGVNTRGRDSDTRPSTIAYRLPMTLGGTGGLRKLLPIIATYRGREGSIAVERCNIPAFEDWEENKKRLPSKISHDFPRGGNARGGK